MKNSDVNINITNGNGGDGKEQLYARAMKSIAKASLKDIIKVYSVVFLFLMTAIVIVFGFTAARDRVIVSNTTEKIFEKNKTEENLRDFYVTPKIQHELDKLVYTLNAERAFVFELHNGKKNTSGLPFRYADMSYEEVNEERATDKVAMKFQNIPLTLYKYPHYLQKEKMIIGDIREIAEIDNDFANHIREVGGVYLGMIYINHNGLPIGFLCVSYHSMENVPNRETIEAKLKEYGNLIGNLLDLETQTKND